VKGWIVLAALLVPAIARADAESCVAASDDGQKLRDEGHLRAAREKLVTCAAEECPSPVRANCVRWLDDVDKRTPSIVIAATANGKDATDVSVSVDGAVVAPHLDGHAILLDPGKHELRYEHAGDPTQEETIILREGETDRSLHVAFGRPPPLALPPNKPPTLAYTMTGVAIGSALGWAGFGLGAFFIVQGYDACRNGSDPAVCNKASNETATIGLAIASDVSLAVALVTTGVAIWAYVKHAHKPAAPTTGMRFDVMRGQLSF
jgi:hypothetical protein